MNHPAELALHKYMSDASSGASDMSEETIRQVGRDVMDALRKQFGKQEKRKFSLRMSNVGRPTCQLWYDKNKPEVATAKSNTFVMNMMIGDIVEAVFKGLLKEAGVKYEDTEKVTLDTGASAIDLKFPSSIGVVIEIDGGAISTNMDGFTKDGDKYYSSSYSEELDSIDIQIDAGATSIEAGFY